MQKLLSAKRKNDAVLRVRHNKTNKSIDIMGANSAAERLLGYQESEVKGQNLSLVTPERIDTHIADFLNEENMEDFASMIRKVIHFEIETKEGKELPASLKVFPLVVDSLDSPEYELLMRDVTLLKKLDELRDYLNKENRTIDQVTGVRNSEAVFSSLSIVHEHIMNDSNVEASLIFTFIDKIAEIRDEYGGEIADKLLRHVAQIINNTVRSGDIVGSIGNDILAMLLLNCNSTDSRAVFTRIKANLRNNPFILGIDKDGNDIEYVPTLSIGYKEIKPSDENTEILAEVAIDALERSYESGGDKISEA